MNKEAQLISLLHEVLKVASQLVARKQVKAASAKSSTGYTGIYSHHSKYNPYRASIWDSKKSKMVSLGAYPSIQKAKQAQKDYKAGRRVTAGTGRVFQIVKEA